MLLSFALILLLGGLSGRLMRKINLPPLLGMLLTGIIVGPSVLNWIDPLTLEISAVLRQIALIVILTRAGLSLSLRDLKKMGRPALWMSFVPACLEILGVIFLAPLFFEISHLDAAIMGSVLAAVSPAVIVPHMLKIQNEGYGIKKGVPQLILAGASIDDVFVIVVFSAFIGIAQGGQFSWTSLAFIPLRIIIGILIGLAVGIILVKVYSRFKFSTIERTMLLLSVSFILVTLENRTALPFSGLLAVMFSGLMIQRKDFESAKQLNHHYNHFWSIASIALFVLVGVSVDLTYLFQASFNILIIIFGALLFRVIGVAISLLGTDLNRKERLFCVIAFVPKATVQASIGGIPLALGLASGNLILVVAVLSIMTTAPLGAFMIEHTYQKLLQKD